MKPRGVEFQVCAYYSESLFSFCFFPSSLFIPSPFLQAHKNKCAYVGHYNTVTNIAFFLVMEPRCLPRDGTRPPFPMARAVRRKGDQIPAWHCPGQCCRNTALVGRCAPAVAVLLPPQAPSLELSPAGDSCREEGGEVGSYPLRAAGGLHGFSASCCLCLRAGEGH